MRIQVYGHDLNVTPVAYAYLRGWMDQIPGLGLDIRVLDEETERWIKLPDPEKPAKILED